MSRHFLLSIASSLLLCAVHTSALGVPAFTYPLPSSASVSAIAVDAAGNTYATGSINSAGLPGTSDAAQGAFGGGLCSAQPIIGPPVTFPCNDAFVIKLNPAGSIVWATYLGGTGNDLGQSIAVDGSGNVYVAGTTQAGSATNNFPTTAGAAFPTLINPGSDAFMAKLSGDGARLVYSTYLPGMGWSAQVPMAIDQSGNAYVAGTVNPAIAALATTAGAFQPAAPTTRLTGAVVKLNAAGSALVYATYLGGSGSTTDSVSDIPQGIAVDSSGNAYVTGFTASADFPVTPGAFQTRPPDQFEAAFVTKLNPSGTGLIYSTYLGGSGSDAGAAFRVDSLGRAHILGTTMSDDFPVTANAFQPGVGPQWAVQGGPTGFLTTLSADGVSLVFSTYFAGAAGLDVDAAGNAYVAGFASLGFPITAGAFQRCFAGGRSDALIVKFAPDGTLVAATYLGGTDADSTGVIAATPSGLVSVAGNTSSADFQGVPAFANFVMSLTIDNPSAPDGPCMTPSLENGASYEEGAIAPGEFVTLRGEGFGPELGAVASPDKDGIWPTQLAGVKVLFDGIAAPVFYAQARQINVQAPYELSGKTTTQVHVEFNAVSTNTAAVSVVPTAPAVFYLDYPNSQRGAVVNQDGSINTPSNPAHPGEYISIFGTGAGVMSPPGVTGGLWPLHDLSRVAPRTVVLINFHDAEVTYAGSAPTLPSGFFQINARVPAELTTYPAYFMEVQIGGGVGGIPPITTTVAIQSP